MKTRYKILTGLCVVAVAGGLGVAFYPWKDAAARKLQSILEAKGFENVRLTIEDMGLHSATLRDITVGTDNPVTLQNLTLSYSPQELRDGNLQSLTVSGLALNVSKQEGKWVIPGFSGGNAEGPSKTLPVTIEEMTAIPFRDLKLADSKLSVDGGTWKLATPVQLEWRKDKAGEIKLETGALTLETGSARINATLSPVTLVLDEAKKEWRGAWEAKDLGIAMGQTVLPVDQGKGTLTISAEKFFLTGNLKSKDNAHHGTINFTAPFSAGEPRLTVTEASMPWKGGRVGVRDLHVPLAGRADIKVNLQVLGVSVDALMQALTGERVSATGEVSGGIPVIIGRDGTISFGKGELNAAGPGTLTMPPELLPGDNQQVALTRAILEDFQYKVLSIAVDQDETGQGINLLIALEGNNPKVEQGRPVKLNVRVEGDVLDFINQNVIFLTKPGEILKRGEQQ